MNTGIISGRIVSGIRSKANVVRNLFGKNSAVKNQVLADCEPVSAETGRDVLRQVENYVEPAQTNFPSTKAMLQYAKARCVDVLKKNNTEHAIFFNTKDNEVLAEFSGDSRKIDMSAIKHIKFDPDNTGVLHGHPGGYPISRADVQFLKQYGVYQVIAVDANGDFSLIAKKYQPVENDSKSRFSKWIQKKNTERKERQAFTNYSANSVCDYEEYTLRHSEECYKYAIHDTLKTYIPPLNLRYVTNYGYIKEHEKLLKSHSRS